MSRFYISLFLLYSFVANEHLVMVHGLNMIHRRHLLFSLITLPVAASPADSICTWGQELEDCVGVYKMPASGGGGTLDPSSARSTLLEQRGRIDNIKSSILSGSLLQGGLELLKVVPRISRAGKSLLSTYNGDTNSVAAGLRSQQMESQLEEIIGLLGQVDVSIGQGIRGEMGSLTMAQLTILKDLQDAQNLMDDFMANATR